MATTDALKGKNALITAASVVGAVALEFVLDRRGNTGKKVSDAVGKLPGNAGDLMDDLGRGVSSMTRKATAAVRGGDDDDGADRRSSDGDSDGDGGELDLEELATRRREREERRERRRKAS
jgi:hypothetical protein